MKRIPLLLSLLFCAQPLLAEDQLISNGDFSNQLQDWDLQVTGEAKATAKIVSMEGGKHGVLVDVTEPGEKRYFVQFLQRNLHLESGKTYTISFRAKAREAADLVIVVSCKENTSIRELWRQEGIALSGEWADYHYTFTVTDPSENVYLLLSGLAKQPDEYTFADISLTEKK